MVTRWGAGVGAWLIWVVPSVVLVFPSPAEAYLDAGTGGLVLQLILGGVAGLFVVLKLYWRRFLAKIGFLTRAAKDQGSQTGVGH